ncbi:MAG: hypothetical protein WKF42_05030 [Solirubrobacteraceae bacterium]
MSPRRLIAAMLVAGVADGFAIALLARGEPTRAATAPIAGVDDPAPVQRAPLAPIGPVTIASRSADPGGGAPWAVRRLTARRRGKTFPCVQLGRLDGERFGWTAPSRPFRLARFDQLDVPTRCGGQFIRGLPELAVETLTTDGASGLPRPDRTVVWGVLPPGVTSARLRDGTLLTAGADRVVLAVLRGRPVGEPRLEGTLRTRGGETRRWRFPRLDPYSANPQLRSRPRPGGVPRSERTAIAARVPDPAGGAAWGILTAPSTKGNTCFSSPAQLVGDRAALVDPRLGIAQPYPFAELDCSNRRAPTAAQPLRMDVLLSSIRSGDPSGTRQLRRLHDRTVLYGRTTADVKAVTITTSRDIRTLVPDPRTHVVIAVYDGAFPGERLKFTATLRDGRRVTLLQSSGA